MERDSWYRLDDREGKSITVDMFSAIRDLELITKKKYIYMTDENGDKLSYD